MRGRKMQALLTTYSGRLDTPPHVAPQLIDMVIADREQLLTHLTTCVHGQIDLETLTARELAGNISDEASGMLEKLLNRLTKIIHETQEMFGAYTDILELRGEAAANRKFPILAEHLKRCKSCRSTIEGTLTLLRQTEAESKGRS